MKRLRYLALLTAILASFAFATAAAAAPPTSRQVSVGSLKQGLVNVDVLNINIGNITVQDVIDVNNVLNNNQVEVLKDFLNRSPIASNNSNILNNLLRDANLITDNQIVVGVLGGTFFVTDLVP
jgi:hypothetical protein